MPHFEREPGAYQVVDRLLALRELLRQSPQTREQIVERLPAYYSDDDSGARKLRRDLQYLERWGYQVVRDRAARTYGVSMKAIECEWADEELEALAAVRECFKGGAPYADTIQAILGRIEAGLDSHGRKLLARKPPLKICLTTVEKPSPAQAVQYKLQRALQQRQRVSFRYRPLGKEMTLHPDDEPIELEFRDEHYYLVAYCYQARDILEYRLDRIVSGSVQILPRRAEGNWKRHMVEFQYRLSPLLASGGVTPRFEVVSYEPQSDGSMIVIARGYSNFWIIREMLRYGEQAELLGPPELRAQIKHKVEQMMALYSQDNVVPDEE